MQRHKSDTEAERELFHIAGDPDEKYDAAKYPHYGSFENGLAQDMRVDKMCDANPTVRYKDFLITCDLYIAPGGGELTLVLICPLCRNQLKISSLQKQIGWDGQKVSVEPFRCTWNVGRSDATREDRMDFGLGQCTWHVGISDGVARDA